MKDFQLMLIVYIFLAIECGVLLFLRKFAGSLGGGPEWTNLIGDLEYIRDHPDEFEPAKRTHLNDGTVYLDTAKDLEGLLVMPVGTHITLINNNGECEFERSGILTQPPKASKHPYYENGIPNHEIHIRLHGQRRISTFTIHRCVVGYRVDRAF